MKFINKFEHHTVKVFFGIFICLFSIFGTLDYGFVSTALTYAVAFLFGNYYFIIFLLLFLSGLKLIFSDKFNVFKKNFISLGILLCFISIIICGSLYTTVNPAVEGSVNGLNLTLSNFSTEFVNSIQYNGSSPVNVFSSYIGGGYIGFFLCALFNSMFTSYIGTLVIVCLFALSGIVFLLYKPFSDLILYISTKKRNKQKQIDSENIPVANSENVDLEENEEKTTEIPVNDVPVLPSPPTSTNETINTPLEKTTSFAAPVSKQNVLAETDTVADSSTRFKEQVISVPEPEKENTIEKEPEQHEDVASFPTNAFNFHSGDTIILRRSDDDSDSLDLFPGSMHDETDHKVVSSMPNDFKTEKLPNENSGIQNNNSSPSKEKNGYENAFNIIDENNDNDQDSIENNENDITDIFGKQDTINNSNSGNSIVTNSIPKVKPNTDSIIKPVEEKSEQELFVESQEEAVHLKYDYPNKDLLSEPVVDPEFEKINRQKNDLLVLRMNEFFVSINVPAKVVDYVLGPSITRFYIQITDLSMPSSTLEKKMDDLARVLNGVKLRFLPIIEGKPYCGIEMENDKVQTVSFKDCVTKLPKSDAKPNLLISFGKSLEGNVVFGKLSDCPHMLVCGTTGSGKSVFEHQLLVTLIMNNSPEDLKLLLIDPKCVELSKYVNIPHLICPVVTDSKKAYVALKKVATEMDNRYQLFLQTGARDLKTYNKFADKNNIQRIPYLVVLIDEYADLFTIEPDVENQVLRIAAKARSAGITLIITTQRPSADVVSGSIKSNINVKVAFQTSNSNNSRIILDEVGAENLRGKGDMLLAFSTLSTRLMRLQSAYISDDDIDNVVDYIKSKYSVNYDSEFLNLDSVDPDAANPTNGSDTGKADSLYPNVKSYAFNRDYVSNASLVRDFSIGFSRGGKLIAALQSDGVIASMAENKTSGFRVLVHSQEELDDNNNEKLLSGDSSPRDL